MPRNTTSNGLSVRQDDGYDPHEDDYRDLGGEG